MYYIGGYYMAKRMYRVNWHIRYCAMLNEAIGIPKRAGDPKLRPA